MTKEGIIEESMKPSTYWIEAGSGDVGKVYFEVLACQGKIETLNESAVTVEWTCTLTPAVTDLPNMDLNLTTRDQTDAFACIAFEDALVHTDVIGDTLSPRWMPWCQRAFVFNISHPSSSLYIGVFDHDHELSPMQLLSRAAADLHDPVGRVQIHLSNFAADTDYTLAYPLYYGEIKEQRKKVRGTLWVRMRVEWGDRRRAIVHAAMPPARNYVSE